MTFDALLLVDDDRRYVSTNPPGAALLGAPREVVLSRAIEDFTSAQFQPLLPELWSTLERDGALSGAYQVLRGDGSVSMIEFAAKRDLFDGRHLIVARELPRTTWPSPTAGFALVNARSGDIEEASSECCRLVGRTRAALLAAGLPVFGGKRLADETLHAVRSLADRERETFTFECAVHRPNGGLQWLVVSLRPVFGARHRPVRILLEALPLVTAPQQPDLLTAREREVLQLASYGGTAATIAERLVLSPGTVRTHLGNIYTKLGVGDRAAAVAEGIRRGLIG
jgi:DNA-binding CsgD family transcriptional regulator